MWGALIAAVVGGIITLISQDKQNKANKQLAAQQHDANKQLLQEQLSYNTPKSQMQRFQDAGLNPHLIFGQGSPGNQSAPLQYPDIKPTDYGRLMDVVPLFNQSMLAQSQVQAQNASTMQKHAMAEVNKVQAEVLRKNPLLNQEGFSAIIDGLKAAANLKETQYKTALTEREVGIATSGQRIDKVFKEIQLLDQRFKLGELDGKLKAEVLTSKEFQNAILEVQKNFMTDGDITPQHIVQFIQLLLMKAL